MMFHRNVNSFLGPFCNLTKSPELFSSKPIVPDREKGRLPAPFRIPSFFRSLYGVSSMLSILSFPDVNGVSSTLSTQMS